MQPTGWVKKNPPRRGVGGQSLLAVFQKDGFHGSFILLDR
jgi:hypothetical protein